jgi:parallel beta-helix repeat protein
MGGDGFFLAGLSPSGDKRGCNDNLFERNDGSHSPNIAFEATFCSGNVFRDNYADRGNYGFWLGFSWDTVLTGNRMIMNRQAGIAVENGHGFEVRGNSFQGNGHGVLLWSKYVKRFAELFPENLTSYGWVIEDNTFAAEGKGIRIATDQDHGIRPMPPDVSGRDELRPHSHLLRKNQIRGCRVGLELHGADRTVIEENAFHGNVEASVREADCRHTHAANNSGA